VNRRSIGIALAGLVLASTCAGAAENQFWPEVQGYFPMDARTRVYLMGSATRAEDADNRDGTPRFEDGTLGVHLDVALEPLLRPGLGAADWEKNRYLWMRIGYNYVGNYRADGDHYHEDRGVLELSAREPAAGGFILTGRLRWDMRDIDGSHSSRYRVRAGFERPLVLQGRDVRPYAHVEVGYDTRFESWNRQRYQAGVEIPLGSRWRIEPYLASQHDSVSSPAHVNALGLIVKYYR